MFPISCSFHDTLSLFDDARLYYVRFSPASFNNMRQLELFSIILVIIQISIASRFIIVIPRDHSSFSQTEVGRRAASTLRIHLKSNRPQVILILLRLEVDSRSFYSSFSIFTTVHRSDQVSNSVEIFRVLSCCFQFCVC
jgi:hypothetical protein